MMFRKLVSFLDQNAYRREVEQYAPILARINALEPAYRKLDDAALRGCTDQLRARLQKGADLEDLLPEAFAAVREAARRTIGLRPYDVQMIGGIVSAARRNRRDAHRRRQDAGGDSAALPECTGRQRRPPGDGERLPGTPRCPLDGAGLSRAGDERRRAAG